MGDANANAIAITAAAGTIEAATSDTLNVSLGSVTVLCDGSQGNWIKLKPV
jgi:hypothetical protein